MGDQAGTRRSAEAYGEVNAAGEHLFEGVGDAKLQEKLRIAGQQRRQPRRQHDPREPGIDAQLQSPADLGGIGGGGFGGFRDAGEERGDLGMKADAGVGERHHPGMPVEQPGADPRFKSRDGAADPRWRQTDGVRRARKAAAFHNRGHHANTG